MNTPKSNIEEFIADYPLIIFGKGEKDEPRCGFTAQVQEIFNILQADYQMVNILQDESLRAAMKEFSDWPTFPQIYIHGEFIGGADIAKELFESGELKELINGVTE
jgi:monothiol glutaredoxin